MDKRGIRIFKQVGRFGYAAKTGHPEISSHTRLAPAIILEDDKPLPGPANSLHQEIFEIGFGRYSIWKGIVYFSTTDNSDPRANGRK